MSAAAFAEQLLKVASLRDQLLAVQVRSVMGEFDVIESDAENAEINWSKDKDDVERKAEARFQELFQRSNMSGWGNT